MFSRINTFGVTAAGAFEVAVETDISKGIPVFEVVGLGSEAVMEARRRVRSAIQNQGYQFPQGRITLNLAPAGKRKQGTCLDLAIAIGILCASGAVPCINLPKTAIIGELSLNGEVRSVKGILSMVVQGKTRGISSFIVPYENRHEALCGCIGDGNAEIFAVESLSQAIDALNGELAPFKDEENKSMDDNCSSTCLGHKLCDFSDIIGQKAAKRALEIAVSGNHNILMMGSVGSGKTMLAKAVSGIMVPMGFQESFEVSQLYSIAGLTKDQSLIKERPFRCVHSGITKAALIGGGKPIELGEISLSHNGVLFVDELTEVSKSAIEALRQPLEERFVRIINCGVKEVIPANFMLVAAANPCPCGNLFEGNGKCNCSQGSIRTHARKISRPILDRIDIQIPVKKVSSAYIDKNDGETSAEIQKRVIRTRKIQEKRYCFENFNTNGELLRNGLLKYCPLDKESKKLLKKAVDDLGISMRGYEKVIKVARTIADMEERESIVIGDIAEALQYRCFDRQEAFAA